MLEPESKKEYTFGQVNAFGPLLQGALMECVNAEYVNYLHNLPFNPYSQTCALNEDGKIMWTICALNSDAHNFLIKQVSAMELVKLRAVNETFTVKSKMTEEFLLHEILEELKTCDAPKHTIRFNTPTAFKSQGEYVFIPTTRLIFQNLLMHYNQVYSGSHEIDEETVEYVASHVRISSYNLISHYFACSAGKINKIPAFVGKTTLSVERNPSLRGLVGMLLKFGEYAGVGIKTSMGMGGMRRLKQNVAKLEERKEVG